MTYSYSQISQYLTCPRRYRHRYLDGWKEKDTRAAMVFGRVFEQALSAYFQREDAAAARFTEWSAYRDKDLHYSKGDTWDRMCSTGPSFSTGFARMIASGFNAPSATCRLKSSGNSPGKNDFVAFVDAVGQLDGTRRLIE